MVELTGPIALKDNEKRIVYGPVLIPDEPDSDGDVVNADRVETVAHMFTEKYGNVDLQHSLNNVGGLVESYILPVDLPVDNGDVIPKGSWILGARVTDDDAWDAVKTGKLTGFSIMAVKGTKASGKSAVKDRVTLADLGDDWIVNAVSLVDQPAVPRAKFLAIKSKQPDAAKAVSLGQLENLLSPANKEGIDMDKEELIAILNEALNPLREQVNNIAQQLGDAANTSETDDDEDDNDASTAAAGKNEGEPADAATDGAAGNVEANDEGAANGDEGAATDDEGAADEATAESSQGEGSTLSPEELESLRKLLATLDATAGNENTTEPAATGAGAGNATGKSLRLTGQDGAASKSTDDDLENDRDAFGRKLR